MHHRLNRHDFDRPEQLKPGTSWPRAAAAYYFKLLGGHAAASALAAPIMGAMPGLALDLAPIAGPEEERLKAAARHYFFQPRRRRRIQSDAMICLLLIGLAFFAWGAHSLIFVAAFAARWMVLSLLDNMPHYGTAMDGGFDGHNMKAPRPLRWLILNQNFHGLHHRSPHLPWFELPAQFESSGEGYSADWLTALLAQLRGPVELEPTALGAEAAE
jgi:fatty acid desaturase